MKDIDLILSGGGANLGYYIGFSEIILKSNKVNVKNVYGCSGGSLVAPYIITNNVSIAKNLYLIDDNQSNNYKYLTVNDWFYPLQYAEKLPFGTRIANLIRFLFLLFLQSAYKNYNMIFLDELESKFTNRDISNIDKKLHIVATSMKTGKAKWFNGYQGNGWKWQDAVKASSTVTLVTQPVKINNIEYIDGGYTDFIPIPKKHDSTLKVILTWDNIRYPRDDKIARGNVIEFLLSIFNKTVVSQATAKLKYYQNSSKDDFVIYSTELKFSTLFDADLKSRQEIYNIGKKHARQFIDDYC